MSCTSKLAKAVRLTLIYLGGNHCYGKRQVHITHYINRIMGLNQRNNSQAIYGSNIASLSIGDFLITEAARMAYTLGYHRGVVNNKEDEATCHRTFWVIYLLEKCATFVYGMSSVGHPPALPWLYPRSPPTGTDTAGIQAIADHDVGCPIIPPEEGHLKDDFEKFVFVLRLGRIFSKAYESLFSVSANLNSIDQYELKIDAMKSELETWRRSIPAEFRPGLPFCGARMAESSLRLHYAYHAMSIALGRLDLYVGGKASKNEARGARMRAAENDLMESARTVARLTICIDIRPYTPLW